jgi:DnaJ-class molecular chaperone
MNEKPKQPDWYAVLEVNPRATYEEIKVAYREKVRLYHPDKTASKEADPRYYAVDEAWRVLRNEMMRSAYDMLRG